MIPLRTTKLDAIPAPLRAFYREHAGQFILDAEPDPRIAKLEAERNRYRSVVHAAAIDAAVAEALTVMRPADEWRGLISREIRDRLRIEDDGDTVRAFVADANGKQREHADGRDMSPADLRQDPAFAEKFGRCFDSLSEKRAAKQPALTDRDVVLPADHSQRDFEAAHAKAAAQGGAVVFADAGDDVPRPSGRDVVLSDDHSQREFEIAYRRASESGGEVVFQ